MVRFSIKFILWSRNNVFFSKYQTDYPDYSENFVNYGTEVKYEEDDEKKFRPSELDRQMENNGQHNFTNEDGEYDEWVCRNRVIHILYADLYVLFKRYEAIML